MKYFISFLFVFLLLIYNSDSQSGWFTLNTGVSTTLSSIYFPSQNSGWASGWDGSIIFTSNGGVNWITQNTGTSTLLNSIRFVNNSTGWAAGANGLILYTSNSGAMWNQQSSPTSQILYCIYFVNNNTGWISGYQGTILKTTNAGLTWLTQNSGVYSYLRAIFFMDSLNGIATGYNGEIIRTSNGGNGWTEISYNATSTLYSVYFFNYNYGWAGGLGSQRTTNSGYSWSLMQGYGTLGIYFTDINTGWQVGFNQIYYTTNSGINWTEDNLNFSGWLYSVYFTSPSTGYICGDYGTIYKTTDGGGLLTNIKQVSSNIPSRFQLYQNYPNPFNPTTKIRYDIPEVRGETLEVRLVIFNILGKEVARLVDEKLSSGSYEAEWDASNFSSGVYFYKIQTSNFTSVKRMVLIK